MENMDRNEAQTEQTLEELLASLNLDIDEPSAQENPPEPAPEPEQTQPEQPAPAKRRRKSKNGSWQKNMVLYLHDLLYLLAILIVSTLVFRVMVVSGTSMTDTLQNGDYLIVLSNIFYREPQPGDIIVASKDSFDSGAPIIKRVIATEGQWVDIDFTNGDVYVGDSLDNMTKLDEPYTRTKTNLQEGIQFPLQVKEGCIFVLGDNRNGSKDSRSPEIGLIDTREVLGKAIFLAMPGKHYATEQRDFGRIGLVN